MTLCASVLIVLSGLHCLGDDRVFAGQYSWHTSGLFAFRTGTREDSAIHLLDLNNNKPKAVFSTKVSKTVQPPICLGAGVTAVGTDGVIYMLNLQGEFVFKSKPSGFKGASGISGRVTEKHLFMTEALWNEKKRSWSHFLYIVDVSGQEPVVKSRFTTIQPSNVICTGDDIIVIGQKKTQRLKIPPELQRDADG